MTTPTYEDQFASELAELSQAQSQRIVDQINATNEGHGNVLLRNSAVFAGAFLAYRTFMRGELLKEIKNRMSVSRNDLRGLIDRIFTNNVEHFGAIFVPALVSGYSDGLKEVGLLKDNEAWVRRTADAYAQRIATDIHKTSTDAVIDGFTAQINRRVPARVAAERVIDAFGVLPNTMKSIVNIWLGPLPGEKKTSKPSKNPVKDRIDTVIANAISRRSTLIGETEAQLARNLAKSVFWDYQIKNGMIPETSRVMWYTARDERVCSVCGPMQGMYRHPTEPWTLPDGRKVWGPGVHPRCRCEQMIVPFVSEEVTRLVLDTFEEVDSTQSRVEKAWVEAEVKRDKDGRFSESESRVQRVKPLERVKPVAVIGQEKTAETPSELFVDQKADLFEEKQDLFGGTQSDLSFGDTDLFQAKTPTQQMSDLFAIDTEDLFAAVRQQTEQKRDIDFSRDISFERDVDFSVDIDFATDLKTATPVQTAERTKIKSQEWMRTDRPQFAILTDSNTYKLDENGIQSGSDALEATGEKYWTGHDTPFYDSEDVVEEELVDYWNDALDNIVEDLVATHGIDPATESLRVDIGDGAYMLIAPDYMYDIVVSNIMARSDVGNERDRVAVSIVDENNKSHQISVSPDTLWQRLGVNDIVDSYIPTVAVTYDYRIDDGVIGSYRGSTTQPGAWKRIGYYQMNTSSGLLYDVVQVDHIDETDEE